MKQNKPNQKQSEILNIKKAEKNSKLADFILFKLDEIMLYTSILAPLVMILAYTFYRPLFTVLAMLYGLAILPMGILIGYFLTPSWRIKILRKITKKPYGFATFKQGNMLIRKAINFESSKIKIGNKIYFINKNMVLDEKLKPVITFNPTKDIYYEEGIPVIFFDIDHSTPIRVEEGKFKLQDNPEFVQANIEMEKNIEIAKAIRGFKTKQAIIAIITLVVAFLALYFAYMNYLMLTKWQRAGIPVQPKPTEVQIGNQTVVIK